MNWARVIGELEKEALMLEQQSMRASSDHDFITQRETMTRSRIAQMLANAFRAGLSE